MLYYLKQYSDILQLSAALSLATFLISLVVIPWIIVRLPADFFITRKTIWNGARSHHPVLLGLILSLKNIIGLGLITAGIAMLFLPGQGLLTILIGISLLNFPGKHRLLARLISIPSILKALNWIRSRSDHEPFLANKKEN